MFIVYSSGVIINMELVKEEEIKAYKIKQSGRLAALLGRFIRYGDHDLSDRDFVVKKFEMYTKYLSEEIVDVNE